MLTQPKAHLTEEEYLALERVAEYKSEYVDGEIFAMGGASERHNLVVTSVVRELGNQLKGRPCKVYSSDMRVRVRESGMYTYPDVVALCGEARFDDEQQDTLLNPSVIIEVLSASTEGYDRGMKFGHYRKLKSLMEYLLISQKEPHVEHYVRQPNNQWLFSEARTLQDSMQLVSIGCTLLLSELYDKLVFP